MASMTAMTVPTEVEAIDHLATYSYTYYMQLVAEGASPEEALVLVAEMVRAEAPELSDEVVADILEQVATDAQKDANA